MQTVPVYHFVHEPVWGRCHVALQAHPARFIHTECVNFKNAVCELLLMLPDSMRMHAGQFVNVQQRSFAPATKRTGCFGLHAIRCTRMLFSGYEPVPKSFETKIEALFMSEAGCGF